MNKINVIKGYNLNGLIVSYAKKRKIQEKQPGSRAWTSIIECISATEASTLPLVIYKGKSV